MAKVYEYNGRSNFFVLLEDPRVTSNEIYIYGATHDKDSLSPVFNSYLNTSALGVIAGAFTGMNNNITNNENLRTGMQLCLTKSTVHVAGAMATINSTANSHMLDDTSWYTMDPSVENGGSQIISDGTNSAVLQTYGIETSTGSEYRVFWGIVPSNTKLADTRPVAISSVSSEDGCRNTKWIGVNTASGIVYGIGQMDYVTTPAYNYAPHEYWIGAGTGWPGTITTFYSSGTNIPTYSQVQFLGFSSIDQSPLFVVTTRNNTTVSVQKVQWLSTTPTVTAMASITGNPTASGTTTGGNFMNANYHPRSCSQTFIDPRDVSGLTKCFYVPYFDTARNFHPFVIAWNTVDDTFSRTLVTNITGDLSSVHADMSTLYSWTISSGTWVSSNMICHTWENNSSRYVTYFVLDTRDQYPSSAGPRTSVVYSVNASDPSLLTYHSKITFPYTVKNIVFLNDSKTLIGVFMQSAFKVYAWNNSTGWSETVSVNTLVTAAGRDSEGRIWYIQSSTTQTGLTPELHILTPSLPVTISINPEFTSYDYAGTPINSYLNISAYNASGTRIAADVKLVINGGSMTFSDSTTVKTVTTLTNGEKQQNIIITGAGYSNITASVEI